MLSSNVIQFVCLQKYFAKPCHLIARSAYSAASKQCQKCQQQQFSCFSSFNSKTSFTKNGLSLISNVGMLSPTLVSWQHTSSIFNQTIKDRLHKWGITMPQNYSQKQLDAAAQVLLNGIYMKVPYKTLREVAGLEDTFLMWLRIVYIHLWFLLCQIVNKGGRDGEILAFSIIKILWKDVTERLKSIQKEAEGSLKSKDVLKEAYNELHYFFLFLDEGLSKGDADMASSLWTLIYSINSYDAETWQMENLVHYIRHTVARMQKINFETFVLEHESIDWEFPNDLLELINEENERWN